MKLNQVTVPVKNIDRSITFYQNLGLRLIVHTNEYYARFECPAEPSESSPATFSIHKLDQLPTGDGVWVYFEVPDVDVFVKGVVERGLHVEEQPEDKKWLWREARLKDPDGNQIILYHAGENRRFPPWRKVEVPDEEHSSH